MTLYITVCCKHLLQESSSLVALWVTNRPRMHRFVREQLLPAWGLQQVATWLWLKVSYGLDGYHDVMMALAQGELGDCSMWPHGSNSR
jgi:hypothetical protein